MPDRSSIVPSPRRRERGRTRSAPGAACWRRGTWWNSRHIRGPSTARTALCFLSSAYESDFPRKFGREIDRAIGEARRELTGSPSSSRFS